MSTNDLNAFLATTDAPSAGGEGLLAGRSVAVKDNICVRGLPCTCGSRILEGWVPPYDATAVIALGDAGATISGKTNMDEFGMGSSTEHSAFGPTLNAHDPTRVAGGSSGGSAAAVAAGQADMAIGSDTGGSVRQPAAFNGVVGLKPTYGLVSRYGLVAYASSLDQIGPITRSVADAGLLLDVLADHDPLDATSIPDRPAVAYRDEPGRDVTGLRVGLLRQVLGEGVDPAIERVVRQSADALAAAGAEVVDIDVPEVAYALSAYYLIAPAEASSNLARFDGVRYGLRVDAPTTHEMMVATRTAGFGAEVKRRIMLGTFALSAGYQDQYYGKALRVRTLLIRGLARAYEQVDALLGPTSPVGPFRLGEKLSDPLSMYLTDVCTVPANLAGEPAISVPGGVDDDGLPVGVQLQGPALSEPTLLRLAAAIEAQAEVPHLA